MSMRVGSVSGTELAGGGAVAPEASASSETSQYRASSLLESGTELAAVAPVEGGGVAPEESASSTSTLVATDSSAGPDIEPSPGPSGVGVGAGAGAGAAAAAASPLQPAGVTLRHRRLLLPRRTAGRLCYASLLLLVLLVAALLVATSWIVVGVHEAALVYNSLQKTLRGDVLGPGRYFLGVSAVPLVYDTRTRTVEFVSYCGADQTPTPDDSAGFTAAADAADKRLRCSEFTWGATEPQARSLEMWTADGQWLTLEASFMYRLVWDELPQLYAKVRFDYETTLIRMATDALKGVSTSFETVAYFSRRGEIREAMFEEVRRVLREMHVEVVAFQLRKVSVAARWEVAIESKLLSAQLRRTVEFHQLTAAIAADIAVVLADADTTVAVEQARASTAAQQLIATVAALVALNVTRAEGAALQGLRQRLGLSEAQLLQYATVRRLVAPSGMPASGAPYDEAAAARGDASHLLVGVSGGGGAGGEPPWLSVVPRG